MGCGFGISSAARLTLGLVLVLILPVVGKSTSADAIGPASVRTGTQPVRPEVTADPACSRADDSPTALTADVTGTTVTLRWFAPFGCTPSSYLVVAGSGPNGSNIAQIPLGSASTTLTATGVPPGIYYVRVLSQAGAARTTPSNEVVVTVGVTCAPPGAPPALWATASAATATLEWDAASASPESYIIEVGSAPGLANLVTLDTGSPATAFSTPAPLGTYYVRVRARNRCATGPASNEVIVAVAAPTPMPSTVTVTGLVELRGAQVIVVSSANVTVRNRINLYDRSVLVIRDSVFNHVADYASQFDLWAYDDSRVIIEHSTLNTPVYTSWHFFDRSILQMTHVVNPGAPVWTGFQHRATGTYAHVNRAYGTGNESTMVQVHHAAESFIEVVFPPGATVDEAFPVTIGAAGYRFPGADERGVSHTVTMTHVPTTRWGITYQPDSDITIRHTQSLVVTFAIPRSYNGLTARFDGVRSMLYQDQTWTTGNSRLRLVDTFCLPWSPMVTGNNTLIVTDSELAEMNSIYDTATAYVVDTTLSQVRARNRAHITLERSYVSGDVIAVDDSVITMTGGGVGGQVMREPRAQIFVNGTRTSSPGFNLGYISTITTRTGEILSGGASIKASYGGMDRFQSIVRTDPTRLPLMRGRTYRATFTYRILAAPSQGFDLTFGSRAAFAQGVFLPNLVITGAAGSAGVGTLTVTLPPYDDYELNLSIVGTGAILVDDLQLLDVATGLVIGTEAAETFLVAPP